MKYSNRHLLCRTHLVMRFCFLLIAFGLFGGGACQLCQKKHVWKNPIPADSVANHCELTTVSKLFLSEDGDSSTSDYRNALFRCVDQAYQTASISNSPAQAVDAYYESIVKSWIFIFRYRDFPEFDDQTDRAWDIYHSSLTKVIENGQRSGRLDLQRGLLVKTPLGMEWLPVRLNAFVWPAESFNELIPVGSYYDSNLRHQFVECGFGCPVVALRKNECNQSQVNDYFLDQTPFAATAILIPDLQPWQTFSQIQQSPTMSQGGLVLYDPLKVAHVQYGGSRYRLAADITAPLGFLGQEKNWNPIEEYIRPETDPSLAGVRMLEPYQPEKIPVLFVHGLFSDPQTYLEMANQIRAQADLHAAYQIWVYRYPTGGNFFLSAAQLRTQLAALLAQCRAQHQNNNLDRMVIIGHSLGGLIAKLQVVTSGNILWNSVACVPFEEIAASPEERLRLAKQFFFTPSPSIHTAIYIATPNEGSPWAKRPTGKLASKIVKYPSQQTQMHQSLIDKNPNVFSAMVRKRNPTSIDLMNPDNAILHAIQRLPLAPWVNSYAIAGTGGSFCSRMGPSDGVITIDSATTPCAGKTFLVDAIHTEILKNDTTIAIVSQILRNNTLTVSPASLR